jgi:NADPH-dependent 7-cyano-7-deazaguanine reductase QueF-like protein
MWTEELAVENGRVIFQIIDFHENVDEIKKEKERIVDFLTKQSANVNRDIELHNGKIEEFVRTKVKEIEGKKAKVNDILASLGNPIVSQGITQTPKKLSQPTQKEEKNYDVFICHASEDKDYVNLLAERLKQEGLEVWYDAFEISWGDDLRPAIDNGLKNSKLGIVILSKIFLGKKKWTEYELNGLFAREKDGKKVIFPIWHKIQRDDVLQYSPTLADRIAKSSDDVDNIVVELKKVIQK